MVKKYLKLNDINAYKVSLELSNYVWDIVQRWDYFPKDTTGKQYVRAIDSIFANIAEGFGRYNKKDKIKFYRYSCASIKESLDWNEKAKSRGLLKNEDYQYILNKLMSLTKEINALIKFTNTRLTI